MHQLTTSELYELAEKSMIENGFTPEFPRNVIEAARVEADAKQDFSNAKDLRKLIWSAIDDASSRDLDQVEFVEKLANGDLRILVGIADVDEFVEQNSVIDAHAAKNTISVYTGSRTFPMLPEELSTDATSLLNDVDRLGIVIEMVISIDGKVVSSDIYRAIVHNYAKLSYEEVGAWLDANTEVPLKIQAVKGLENQIRLQLEAASRLKKLREKNGALQFESVETSPVIKDGHITGLKVLQRNSARDIIENFMIAANVTMAEFLENHNSISVRRIVKTPARWDGIVKIAATFGVNLPENPDSNAVAKFLESRKKADPSHFPDLSLSIVKLLGPGEYVVQKLGEEVDGHFGLAVRDYAHSTAPNRRYADIITQRLVKAVMRKSSTPYTVEELESIANHCNERLSAARKVERQMRKTIAASVLANRIGDEFDAIVTGVKSVGTFARLLNPPADGRIVNGEKGLDVGEKIRVRLVGTNPYKGFIDFECLR
jgi:VacB/RNase II family 3'-5' exoribonuclease